MGYIEVDYDHMRSVMQERSQAQGAIRLECRVDDRIPVSAPAVAPPELEAPEPIAEPLLITHVQEQPVECADDQPALLAPAEEALATYKLLTQLPNLKSERYSLVQAMLPAGTGLSHELSWDGPGTWWEDLGIPPPSTSTEERYKKAPGF